LPEVSDHAPYQDSKQVIQKAFRFLMQNNLTCYDKRWKIQAGADEKMMGAAAISK
jgi:hypothetical protein